MQDKTPEEIQKDEWATTWPGLDIHRLIYELEGDYIVCLDSKLDVDWRTSDKYDSKDKKDAHRYNNIINHVAVLESTPNDHLRPATRLNFKRMVAEGMARCLAGEYGCAEEILHKAQEYIASRNFEMARFWQLSTGFCIALLFFLLAMPLWVLRDNAISWLGETAYYIGLCTIAGGLGAVLSMIFRMGKSYPSSESPRKLHILEAVSRVLAGSICAIVVALSIKMGLVLTVLAKTNAICTVMVLASIGAGLSEKWAPSIISGMERGASKNKDKGGEKQ